MAKKQPHYCGECCFMINEDADGKGFCVRDYPYGFVMCDKKSCGRFISREERDAHLRQMLREIAHGDENSTTVVLRFAVDYITKFSKL